MMRATPISVHFSIAHSMRSNLKMARANVILGAAPGKPNFSDWCPFVPSANSIAIIGDRSDGSATNLVASGNIEFLANFRAQDASQMRRMFADQSGSVSGYFVGNPAAAGHKTAFSSQLSAISKGKFISSRALTETEN